MVRVNFMKGHDQATSFFCRAGPLGFPLSEHPRNSFNAGGATGTCALRSTGFQVPRAPLEGVFMWPGTGVSHRARGLGGLAQRQAFPSHVALRAPRTQKGWPFGAMTRNGTGGTKRSTGRLWATHKEKISGALNPNIASASEETLGSCVPLVEPPGTLPCGCGWDL